jgi:hypothetical protein
VLLSYGLTLLHGYRVAAENYGHLQLSIAWDCGDVKSIYAGGSVRHILENQGSHSPDSQEDVPMSPATQLHNLGYLADYMQIMSGSTLPGNVYEDVCGQV